MNSQSGLYLLFLLNCHCPRADYFVGLCCKPLKGQFEICFRFNQPAHYSGRPTKGKQNGVFPKIVFKHYCHCYLFYGGFFFPFQFQSVATIGSTLTSVQHDVKTMQTALETQKNSDDELKATLVNSSTRRP